MTTGFLEVALESPFSYQHGVEAARAWQWQAFVISISYAIVIFTIKAVMTNFKPFDVRTTLGKSKISSSPQP